MYCIHCGYDLNEKKQIKAKQKASVSASRTEHTKIAYVCPRCGHVINDGISEEETKSLARASHAEIHRASNSRNRGSAFLVIGGILLIVAFMFFLMSFKAASGRNLVTNCTEFVVFVVLGTISLGALGYGLYALLTGIFKNKKYTQLLKDTQNHTFIQ